MVTKCREGFAAGKDRTSTAFNRDDLPLVAEVADLAHTYIFGVAQNDMPF